MELSFDSANRLELWIGLGGMKRSWLASALMDLAGTGHLDHSALPEAFRKAYL